MNNLNPQEMESVLVGALTEFDESFEKAEYPSFILPEFVPIESIGGYGNKYTQYGKLDGRGDLDAGLIGDSTTSLETANINIELIDAPVRSWMQATQWNLQALHEAQHAGLPIDTWALENLRNLAMQTLQKVGFVGHSYDKRLQGLLTNSDVEASTVKPTKPLDKMTGEEARQFFISLFKAAYVKTGSNTVANTLAIDTGDLMTLRAMDGSNILNSNGAYVSALSQIEYALSDIAGHEVKIRGIPSEFAKGINGKKNRAVIYTNESDVLRMNIPVMPETAGEIIRKSSLSFESALYMRFGGVDIRQPDLITYVDYDSSTP